MYKGLYNAKKAISIENCNAKESHMYRRLYDAKKSYL